MGAGFKVQRRDSVWWKDLMAASSHYTNEIDYFAGHVSFSFGDGGKILFWFGKWLGGIPFKELFPLLFNSSSKQLATVKEMGVWCDQQWQWEFHVDSDLMLAIPELLQEALELLEILGGYRPTVGVVDSIKWWPSREGVFTVKSCCSLMRICQLEDVVEANRLAAINRIWKSSVPSKIKVFGWRFFLNRLPTKDQLAKRNVLHRIEDKLCVLCSVENEDLFHLCFLCSFARSVWINIGTWLDISLTEPLEGYLHFSYFLQALKGKMKRKKLSLI
ncbi:uncharacterized protein LOC131623286 [Vicia villosa]|uniref:uncharacterized protein LOC131623286 n=1 Tax=Vicia villosa TaxID=3911 RepID=UPI00273C9C73|nr:uncharacterized protein LOC131623286 [Vicia villosa]